MRKVYFTVGPSQLYPTVESHIKTAMQEGILSTSHRGEQFHAIVKNTIKNLRKLLLIPDDYHVFFQSSATEAMERIIENTVEKYSFHLVDGAFSLLFYNIARSLGKDPAYVKAEDGRGIDARSLKRGIKTECICLTQNETSTGVSFPIKDIYSLKKKNPDALLAVDIVSSTPFVDVDISKLDIAFFSVQKGFGLPSGLGVLIVSPKAMQKAKTLKNKGINIGSYHNFISMDEYMRKYEAHETPNILYIYLLGKVCEDIIKRDINVIRSETVEKARLIYEFFDKHPKYKPFVTEAKYRSSTIIVIDTQGESDNVIKFLENKGYVVGYGYGQNKNNQIRISNFPSHSVSQVMGLLEAFGSIK